MNGYIKYTYNGIFFNLKKKGNSDIFHNIKVEVIMLSEVSRTHKKQILLGFTYEIPFLVAHLVKNPPAMQETLV